MTPANRSRVARVGSPRRELQRRPRRRTCAAPFRFLTKCQRVRRARPRPRARKTQSFSIEPSRRSASLTTETFSPDATPVRTRRDDIPAASCGHRSCARRSGCVSMVYSAHTGIDERPRRERRLGRGARRSLGGGVCAARRVRGRARARAHRVRRRRVCARLRARGHRTALGFRKALG